MTWCLLLAMSLGQTPEIQDKIQKDLDRLRAQAADEKIFSGPQPGEKLAPFKVQGVFEPNAGKELTLLDKNAKGPVLLIFVHEITRPALQLLRPLDVYGTKLAKDGLATHFVWLSADKAKSETFLNNARKSLALTAPVAISVDGIEGPGSYGLNRKATLTIILGKDHRAVANFAIVQPNETDAPKILEAVAKLMGKKPPTADELKVAERPMPKGGRPPELTSLMRRMIQKTNDAAIVKQIADEMTKWAGDDRQKQAELRAYCQQVFDLGYGTEEAKQALKKLAGK